MIERRYKKNHHSEGFSTCKPLLWSGTAKISWPAFAHRSQETLWNRIEALADCKDRWITFCMCSIIVMWNVSPLALSVSVNYATSLLKWPEGMSESEWTRKATVSKNTVVFSLAIALAPLFSGGNNQIFTRLDAALICVYDTKLYTTTASSTWF